MEFFPLHVNNFSVNTNTHINTRIALWILLLLQIYDCITNLQAALAEKAMGLRERLVIEVCMPLLQRHTVPFFVKWQRR